MTDDQILSEKRAFRDWAEENDYDALDEALFAAFVAGRASIADTAGAFNVALRALDDYQANWDTGLPSEYAQSERTAMECAVEAVRDALNDAEAGASKRADADTAGAKPVEDSFRSEIEALVDGWNGEGQQDGISYMSRVEQALYDHPAATPASSVADMTENDIARVIFANLFPRGMCPADWDSGAILGPDNCVREQFLAAARALLSASIADTAGALSAEQEREQFGLWLSDFTNKHGHPPDIDDAWQARAALSSRADGGKGEAVYQVLEDLNTWTDVEYDLFENIETNARRIVYTAPQAECAPREAQPVAEVVIEADYWSRGHFYEGSRKEAKLLKAFHDLPVGTKLYAAPTPERADADTADYKRMFEEAVSALAAIDKALGIDPDEAGGAAPILEAIERLRDDGKCKSCIDNKCVTGPECVTLGRDAAPTPERADAGKDAMDLAAGASEGQAVGFMMKHKTGMDIGFAWKQDDPKFSADWIRIPLYLHPSAEIAALRERIAGMEKDAEDAARYRWLEGQAKCDPKMGGNHHWWGINLRGVHGPTLAIGIDAAIDRARQSGEEGK